MCREQSKLCLTQCKRTCLVACVSHSVSICKMKTQWETRTTFKLLYLNLFALKPKSEKGNFVSRVMLTVYDRMSSLKSYNDIWQHVDDMSFGEVWRNKQRRGAQYIRRVWRDKAFWGCLRLNIIQLKCMNCIHRLVLSSRPSRRLIMDFDKLLWGYTQDRIRINVDSATSDPKSAVMSGLIVVWWPHDLSSG